MQKCRQRVVVKDQDDSLFEQMGDVIDTEGYQGDVYTFTEGI